MKFRANYMQSTSVVVKVEIDDKELEGLDEDAIRALVDERATDEVPDDLCIHCCGMGMGSNFSRDIDGELRPYDGDDFIERVENQR